jgi:hypothetical protein
MRQDVLKWVALVIGSLFIILGIFGLFGVQMVVWFSTSLLLGIIHLISGAIGLWAFWKKFARAYARWAGLAYLAIGLFGLIWSAFAGWLGANGATNGLHLVFGVVLTVLGFLYHAPERQPAAA